MHDVYHKYLPKKKVEHFCVPCMLNWTHIDIEIVLFVWMFIYVVCMYYYLGAKLQGGSRFHIQVDQQFLIFPPPDIAGDRKVRFIYTLSLFTICTLIYCFDHLIPVVGSRTTCTCGASRMCVEYVLLFPNTSCENEEYLKRQWHMCYCSLIPWQYYNMVIYFDRKRTHYSLIKLQSVDIKPHSHIDNSHITLHC